MEVSNAIKSRRSIRHYNAKKVSKDIIEDILEHGIKAPSAHNRQPWEFYVINDTLKKEEIATILKDKTDVSTTLTCEVIKECSSIILVFADVVDDVMDIQSVGACIENIILRATELNIATLWIGYIVKIEGELQKMFNTNKKLIAAVSLGYTDKMPKERPRKELKEVTNWYL